MDKSLDWEQILQKSKRHVQQLTTRALLVGMGIGSLILFVGLSMILFTDSLIVMLLSPVCIGAGFLFGIAGIVRAWQIRSWPLLLVSATVLERHKATYRGVRHYVRLHVLEATTFHLNGERMPAAQIEPELDYMTSPQLFNKVQEGEAVTLICAPRLHEIIDQLDTNHNPEPQIIIQDDK